MDPILKSSRESIKGHSLMITPLAPLGSGFHMRSATSDVPAEDQGLAGLRPWAVDRVATERLWFLSERLTNTRLP